MKVKDILTIIEQNEWYKNQIKRYRTFSDRTNFADVLEHNYKKWLEMEIIECEGNNEYS